LRSRRQKAVRKPLFLNQGINGCGKNPSTIREIAGIIRAFRLDG